MSLIVVLSFFLSPTHFPRPTNNLKVKSKRWTEQVRTFLLFYFVSLFLSPEKRDFRYVVRSLLTIRLFKTTGFYFLWKLGCKPFMLHWICHRTIDFLWSFGGPPEIETIPRERPVRRNLGTSYMRLRTSKHPETSIPPYLPSRLPAVSQTSDVLRVPGHFYAPK